MNNDWSLLSGVHPEALKILQDLHERDCLTVVTRLWQEGNMPIEYIIVDDKEFDIYLEVAVWVNSPDAAAEISQLLNKLAGCYLHIKIFEKGDIS